MQETQVQTQGWEDTLEKEMATPIFLPGEFQAERSLRELQRVGHVWGTNTNVFSYY